MVRLKNRYILFDILYPPATELPNYQQTTTLKTLHQTSANISLRTIAELIKHQIQVLFGDQGLGLAGLSTLVKYFSSKTSTGILRVSREHVKYVQVALTSIRKINGTNVIMRIITTSGTIKKCEECAIERNNRLVKTLKLIDFKDEDIGHIVEDDDED